MSQDQDSGKRAESWKLHDTYQEGISCSDRIITRSQTAFLRLKNTPSDTELFADESRHEHPGKPDLMVALKGFYGSVPRTILTRDVGKIISVDETLCETVDAYKSETVAEKVKKSVSGWFSSS